MGICHSFDDAFDIIVKEKERVDNNTRRKTYLYFVTMELYSLTKCLLDLIEDKNSELYLDANTFYNTIAPIVDDDIDDPDDSKQWQIFNELWKRKLNMSLIN